ncbi:hypothetical protein LBMAG44_03760 [Gemmatimonadota bacterium]|nr:hypothetical protein LBMAG44_03760 [Gemmatimonadota bacterium]
MPRIESPPPNCADAAVDVEATSAATSVMTTAMRMVADMCADPGVVGVTDWQLLPSRHQSGDEVPRMLRESLLARNGMRSDDHACAATL